MLSRLVEAGGGGVRVLATQDTTVIRSLGGGGDYLHVVLAVDAENGAILGLIHACFLSRGSGRRQTRRERPVEEKESQRWLEGARRSASVCGSAAGLTVIADRESDIYEAFARRPVGGDLLVRAAQDRCLDDGGRLFATTDALAEAGRTTLSLPAGPGRPARNAALAVRFTRVVLAQPKNGRRGGDDPTEIAVYLVDWPILHAFSRKLEGKTARQKNPQPERSLAFGTWVCARLGGWTGYYGKPDPVVMLDGWLYTKVH